MRELFDNDPTRGKHLTAEGARIYVDYSKNRVTEETLKLKLVCLYEHGVFTQGVIWTINPFDQSQSLGAICHW